MKGKRKMAGLTFAKSTFIRIFYAAPTLVLACMLNTMAVQPSAPAQGNVLFGANLTTNNACFIIVRNGGTMVQNPGGSQMSSRFAGGQSG